VLFVLVSSKSGATKAPEIEEANLEKSNSPEKSDEKSDDGSQSQAPLPAPKLAKFTDPLKAGDKFTFGVESISTGYYKFILTKEKNDDGTKETIEVVRPITKWYTAEMQNSALEIGIFETNEKLFLCITQYMGHNNPDYFVLFSGNNNSCVQASNKGPACVFYDPNDEVAGNNYVLKSSHIFNEEKRTYWFRKV
jgi:hypothetical protein